MRDEICADYVGIWQATPLVPPPPQSVPYNIHIFANFFIFAKELPAEEANIGIAYEFFPPFSNPVRIPIGIFISYRNFYFL